MKSIVEPLEGNKVKLSIEVDEAEFEKALDAAYRRIAKEVRIPGFRPGKAPRRLLEARLGAGPAREEALRTALPEYYTRAVRDHEVDVIAPPDIEVTGGEEGGAVAFDAVVEVRPVVSVGGYANLRVTLPRPEPTEAEVDGQVERLREQFGELRTVERAAADRDHVSLSLSGSRGGEAVPGLSADDYLYRVGSGGIVPELDEQLRGAKVGDVLEFTATPPGTEDALPVQFRVLVKEVKEHDLPEVTDEWANEVSEFDTVDELRADLNRRIGDAKKIQAQLALREQVVDALVELVEEDAPEPLVAAEMQQRLESLAHRLSSQGITAEQYLEVTGQTQESLTEELRRGGERAVKADLALRGVADAESLECTDDDLEAEIEQVAERLEVSAAKVRREFERSDQLVGVRSEVRKRKALDWLLDHVEAVDDEGNPIDQADLRIAEDDNETDGEDETDDQIDDTP